MEKNNDSPEKDQKANEPGRTAGKAEGSEGTVDEALKNNKEDDKKKEEKD